MLLNKINKLETFSKMFCFFFKLFILKTYIKENNISLIVDKKAIVLGNVDFDITNTIIEKLNKELPSLTLK